MGKVVTSEGLTEFVQSGKHEKIAPLKKGEAPKLETVKPSPTVDVKPLEKPNGQSTGDSGGDGKADTRSPQTNDELTAEEKALPEKAQKEIQRAKRAVNEKHRLMREAQEAAEEAERFGEQQFNERRLQEQRAAAAEARAAELEAKANPPKPEPKEPVISDYMLEDGKGYDWVKFQKDSIAFAKEQTLKEFKAQQAETDAARAKEARLVEMRANANEVRKLHPDFDSVMTALQGTDADKVPNFVLSYIEESARSAEIAYQLAKNPELREKISTMKPILGIADLGKLEASLVAPSAAASPATRSVTPVTNGGAPAPITPLDGEGDGGHIQTDPSKMSYKELRAYHKAKDAERRRH